MEYLNNLELQKAIWTMLGEATCRRGVNRASSLYVVETLVIETIMDSAQALQSRLNNLVEQCFACPIMLFVAVPQI